MRNINCDLFGQLSAGHNKNVLLKLSWDLFPHRRVKKLHITTVRSATVVRDARLNSCQSQSEVQQ